MQNDNLNTAAGPGATQEETVSPRPLLEGASEFEYVEILNPLSVNFVGVFGVTRPVSAPVVISTSPEAPGATRSENDVRTNYGLDLKNPNHDGKANITNKVEIKSGSTVRLLGNEAQVIVRQLVNEILQREGKKLMLADPYQRHLVEVRIVQSRGSVQDILGTRPQTVHEQLQNAIKEPEHEPEAEFAAATASGTSETSGTTGNESVPRASGTRGRRAQADPTPDQS